MLLARTSIASSWIGNNPPPGFFSNDWDEPCRDPEHNPPTMMYVPPGTTYTHRCPSCGKESVIKSPRIWV